jgi:hypothetical protein
MWGFPHQIILQCYEHMGGMSSILFLLLFCFVLWYWDFNQGHTLARKLLYHLSNTPRLNFNSMKQLAWTPRIKGSVLQVCPHHFDANHTWVFRLPTYTFHGLHINQKFPRFFFRLADFLARLTKPREMLHLVTSFL